MAKKCKVTVSKVKSGKRKGDWAVKCGRTILIQLPICKGELAIFKSKSYAEHYKKMIEPKIRRQYRE